MVCSPAFMARMALEAAAASQSGELLRGAPRVHALLLCKLGTLGHGSSGLLSTIWAVDDVLESKALQRASQPKRPGQLLIRPAALKEFRQKQLYHPVSIIRYFTNDHM